MNVVANLLALVSQNRIRSARHDALHQVCEEAVQLRSGMTRSREAASAEHTRLHAEVAAILLHHDVGGDLGSPEHAVQRVVDREVFGNTVPVRMPFGYFSSPPPRLHRE